MECAGLFRSDQGLPKRCLACLSGFNLNPYVISRDPGDATSRNCLQKDQWTICMQDAAISHHDVGNIESPCHTRLPQITEHRTAKRIVIKPRLCGCASGSRKSVLVHSAKAKMEVLSQKSTCASVTLHWTNVSTCRQQSIAPYLRSSAGPPPFSRALPSIDMHKFAGSSGQIPGNIPRRSKRGRSSLICAAGRPSILSRDVE